jgi:crossover junction endodeoxyribonuclease RuvC
VRIFGIDPGSERTGYGCVERTGSRHHLVLCGSLAAPASATFPERLKHMHTGLAALIDECRPDCVAVENIFHAKNVRSALKLGHARGVALLAASQAGLCVFEYAPAEIKRAVVGFGRAEKPQVHQMVRLLLGIETLPGPYDVSDALAAAICHLHNSTGAVAAAVRTAKPARGTPRSWREYRPS